MDKQIEELFTKLRTPSKYDHRDSAELERVIETAARDQDWEVLLRFLLSGPIPYYGTFPQGAAYDWYNLSIKVVLPALAQDIDADVVQPVCTTLGACDGKVGPGSFSYEAFALLEKSGELANKPLCDLVAFGVNTHYSVWKRAVQFLEERKYEDAPLPIVQGTLRRYGGSAAGPSEVDTAIRAIVAIDAPNTEVALGQFLGSKKEDVRFEAVRSLKENGNRRALSPLQSRLGGLFKKPEEPNPNLRNLIKTAIEEIKRRGK